MIAPNKAPNGTKRKRQVKRSFSPLWLIFVVFALVAGVVIFFITSKDPEDSTTDKPKASGMITEVKPVIASNLVAEVQREEPKPVVPKKRAIPDKVKPDEYGVLRWPGGARYIEEYYYHTNSVNPYAGQKVVFKHPSDVHVSTLLRLKPGQMILGGIKYDKFFDKAFVESLEEDIEFNDDDTEEERQAKEDVIEARKILKEAMDRGESPAKVMQETRDELLKMFQYKQDLAEQIAALKQNEDMTDADVLDLYEAANAMLRDKGISEFSTKLLQRRLGRLAEEEK